MALFKDQNPDLMKDYDHEGNNALGLDLNTIRCSSNKQAYWKCQTCGGSWEATFAERNRHKGCPYCSGKRVLEGYNDLKTKFPEIAGEWDYEKNGDFLPTRVSSFSSKTAFWICKRGHSYPMVIANRTSQNQGCPYCAGKRVLPGFNDLESRFPEIAKEWDYVKNAPLCPGEITYGSSRIVWWKCSDCGNEWAASVSSRTRGQGCKICGNKRGTRKRIQSLVETGSSVANKAPWLLKEWSYEMNPIGPENTPFGSDKRRWWVCEKGHSYDLRVADKVRGQGCPYCAGKRVLPGFNDLESHDPELLSDWDYENNTINPGEITYGSGKKVFWKCQNCGRSYALSVQEKRRRGNKFCPLCKKEFGSSIPEQVVFYYVSQVFPDAVNGYRDYTLLGMKELDVFIPSIKTAIEYDGQAWHDNKKRDNEKAFLLKTAGISLIRLRETGAPEIEDNSYMIPILREANEADYSFLQKPVEMLLNYLSTQHGIQVPTFDISQDIHSITTGFLRLQKENSLAKCYPSVAGELHPAKNQGLDPDRIGCRSGQMVWWKCPKCGNEWKSRIIDRTTKGQGCKACGNKRGAEKRNRNTISESGSFADRYPELLKEWDNDKNEPLSPCDFTVSSGRKVWWKCLSCGHEWQATINDRTRGQGCKECGNRRAQRTRLQGKIKKEGSLADRYPEIADEWDYSKNESLLPSDFTFASNRKVWWKCKICGNEWKSRVSQRTRGQGCPQCYKERVLEGQIAL